MIRHAICARCRPSRSPTASLFVMCALRDIQDVVFMGFVAPDLLYYQVQHAGLPRLGTVVIGDTAGTNFTPITKTISPTRLKFVLNPPRIKSSEHTKRPNLQNYLRILNLQIPIRLDRRISVKLRATHPFPATRKHTSLLIPHYHHPLQNITELHIPGSRSSAPCLHTRTRSFPPLS